MSIEKRLAELADQEARSVPTVDGWRTEADWVAAGQAGSAAYLAALDPHTIKKMTEALKAARQMVAALDLEKRERSRERAEDASPMPMDLWFEGVEGVLLRRAFAALDALEAQD